MLSSPCNLDEALEPTFRKLRARLEVDRLHAAELGIGRIAQIAPDLLTLIDRFKIKFDLYRLFKVDYAVIQFFDQVFDQGLNPAVGWLWYWTPLPYALLLALAHLFDETDDFLPLVLATGSRSIFAVLQGRIPVGGA